MRLGNLIATTVTLYALGLPVSVAIEASAPVLELYYSFNQRPRHGIIRDLSRNHHDGSAVDVTWMTRGRIGGTLGFNGATSLVRTPVLDTTGAMTWSAWIYPESWPTSHDSIVQIIGVQSYAWCWNSDNTSIYFGYWDWNPGCKLSMGFLVQKTETEGDVITHDFGAPPQLRRWHHVVGTIGPAGRALYLDGVCMARSESTQTFGSPAAVLIGANPNGPQRFFDGRIDEVMILNTALTARQVRMLYCLQGGNRRVFNVECPTANN